MAVFYVDKHEVRKRKTLRRIKRTWEAGAVTVSTIEKSFTFDVAIILDKDKREGGLPPGQWIAHDILSECENNIQVLVDRRRTNKKAAYKLADDALEGLFQRLEELWNDRFTKRS